MRTAWHLACIQMRASSHAQDLASDHFTTSVPSLIFPLPSSRNIICAIVLGRRNAWARKILCSQAQVPMGFFLSLGYQALNLGRLPHSHLCQVDQGGLKVLALPETRAKWWIKKAFFPTETGKWSLGSPLRVKNKTFSSPFIAVRCLCHPPKKHRHGRDVQILFIVFSSLQEAQDGVHGLPPILLLGQARD